MIASFLEAYTAPKREVPRGVYLTVSTLVGLWRLLAWCTLSYGGLVRSDFLPTPVAVVQAGIDMARDGSLFVNTAASVTEIMAGFIVASLISVPLGILIGSFKIVEAAGGPGTQFGRYLPGSALIPLLLLLVGIGVQGKITV